VTMAGWTPFGPPVFPLWNPADDGYLGGNSDPATGSGGGLLVAGTLYLARLPVRAPTTITSLWAYVSAVGVGASTGSFVGLCAPGTGQLLTGSADVGATFTGTTGWKQLALATPQALLGGPTPASWPFALILCNLATTQVTLLRQENSIAAEPQAVTNVAQLRWASQAAFGAALGNVTLASNVASAFTNVVLWN
jgi:hypothetical protein